MKKLPIGRTEKMSFLSSFEKRRVRWILLDSASVEMIHQPCEISVENALMRGRPSASQRFHWFEHFNRISVSRKVHDTLLCLYVQVRNI